MNRYDLYHGGHHIRTYTAARMNDIYTQARHDFERYRWEAKQEGRPTSPFGFRLIPTKRPPTPIHEGWLKGAADD